MVFFPVFEFGVDGIAVADFVVEVFGVESVVNVIINPVVFSLGKISALYHKKTETL